MDRARLLMFIFPPCAGTKRRIRNHRSKNFQSPFSYIWAGDGFFFPLRTALDFLVIILYSMQPFFWFWPLASHHQPLPQSLNINTMYILTLAQCKILLGPFLVHALTTHSASVLFPEIWKNTQKSSACLGSPKRKGLTFEEFPWVSSGGGGIYAMKNA